MLYRTLYHAVDGCGIFRNTYSPYQVKDLMEEQAELLKGLTETVAELVKVLTKEKAAKTAKAK